MEKIINAHKAKFGGLLLILIVIGELVLGSLKIATWPAFIIMVIFMMMGSDKTKMVNILLGGLLGIACILVIGPFVTAFAPLVGPELAKLLFIVVFVALIILLDEVLPWLFNTYAFMLLLVTAVAVKAGNPQPFVWMATELIGGGLLMGGVAGIHALLAPHKQ